MRYTWLGVLSYSRAIPVASEVNSQCTDTQPCGLNLVYNICIGGRLIAYSVYGVFIVYSSG